MMELMEGRKTKEEQAFPKNVRQIGETGEGRKILVEDYAYTFLRQLAEENLTCVQTAILIGYTDVTGVYIQGALALDMGQEMKEWFSHEHWRLIFQEIQTWFEGLDVVGWYLSNPGFPTTMADDVKNIHLRNFAGEDSVFLQMDVIENEETFYGMTDKGLLPLSGYYIYYEKNGRMQAYMSQRRGGAGIEPEGVMKDRATTRFRSVMQEKKEQNSQRRATAFLYTSCIFLVMVILVIGITMVNHYDRMSDMELALDQISASLDEAVYEENQQAVQEEEPEAGPEQNAEDEEEPEPVMEEAVPVMSQTIIEPEPYQVKMGDTLLQISRMHYGTEDMVEKICEYNTLDDENKIYVGQTILLP